MKVSVKKLSKNDNTFRTELIEVDGMPFPPEKGESLLLTSSTHESGGVITSLVKDFQKRDNIYLVKTLNSEYEITIKEREQL